MENNWLDFDDLNPIFKVTLLRLLDNGLSAPCLLKEWEDFDQNCTAIFLGHASADYILVTFTLFLKVRLGLRLLVNGLSAP